MAGLEMLAAVDYSLCIKAGVHFTLCGGAHCVPCFRFALAPSTRAAVLHCMPACLQGFQSPAVRMHAGTIAKLGTEKHHRAFLPRLDTLDLPGCFGYASALFCPAPAHWRHEGPPWPC